MTICLARRGDQLDKVDGRLAVNVLFHDSGTYQRNGDRQGAEAQPTLLSARRSATVGILRSENFTAALVVDPVKRSK